MRDCLRLRAAHAGRSMEAEARAILTAACAGDVVPARDPSDVQAWIDELYGETKPQDTVGALLAARRQQAGPA